MQAAPANDDDSGDQGGDKASKDGSGGDKKKPEGKEGGKGKDAGIKPSGKSRKELRAFGILLTSIKQPPDVTT